MHKVPHVFVSSTCYDLGQSRADIRIFLETIGLEPILSEYDCFPVNPDLGTVQNCLNNVEKFADIFILIVGNRYGSQNEDGKSITNLEYLKAKTKGIPIYVFIAKPIITMLPVWRDNKEGTFTSVVDSPKVFEFADTIKSTDNLWVFPFEHAQDIILTLKKQLAHLFLSSLELRRRVYSKGISNVLNDLNGEALKIVIEKPLGWEYLLFSQLLADGIKSSRYLKRDLQFGIVFGQTKEFSSSSVLPWLSNKIEDIKRITSGLGLLINVAFVESVGAPGQPGDPEYIVYVAEKITETYQEAIKWSLDFKKLNVDEEWQKLVDEASKFTEDFIAEIEELSNNLSNSLQEAFSKYRETNEPVNLEFKLTFAAPKIDVFTQELNRLAHLPLNL